VVARDRPELAGVDRDAPVVAEQEVLVAAEAARPEVARVAVALGDRVEDALPVAAQQPVLQLDHVARRARDALDHDLALDLRDDRLAAVRLAEEAGRLRYDDPVAVEEGGGHAVAGDPVGREVGLLRHRQPEREPDQEARDDAQARLDRQRGVVAVVVHPDRTLRRAGAAGCRGAPRRAQAKSTREETAEPADVLSAAGCT